MHHEDTRKSNRIIHTAEEGNLMKTNLHIAYNILHSHTKTSPEIERTIDGHNFSPSFSFVFSFLSGFYFVNFFQLYKD